MVIFIYIILSKMTGTSLDRSNKFVKNDNKLVQIVFYWLIMFKSVLHLLPGIIMFCTLFKTDFASYRKMSKKLNIALKFCKAEWFLSCWAKHYFGCFDPKLGLKFQCHFVFLGLFALRCRHITLKKTNMCW